MRSPGTRPWVAKAITLTPERSIDLTAPSFAAAPRNTSAVRSASSASAMPRTSSAVSGSLGNSARSALSTPSILGKLRKRIGTPRTASALRLMRAPVGAAASAA